jgi:hypothetical protein
LRENFIKQMFVPIRDADTGGHIRFWKNQ